MKKAIFTILIILAGILLSGIVYLGYLPTAIVGQTKLTPSACSGLVATKDESPNAINVKVFIIRDTFISFQDTDVNLPDEARGKKSLDTKLSNSDLSYICQGLLSFQKSFGDKSGDAARVVFTDFIDYRNPVSFISKASSASVISDTVGTIKNVSSTDWKIDLEALKRSDPGIVKTLAENRPDSVLFFYNNGDDFTNTYIESIPYNRDIHVAATAYPVDPQALFIPIFVHFKPSWVDSINLPNILSHEFAHFLEFVYIYADRPFPPVHGFASNQIFGNTSWIASNEINGSQNKSSIEAQYINNFILHGMDKSSVIAALNAFHKITPQIQTTDLYQNSLTIFNEYNRQSPNILEIPVIDKFSIDGVNKYFAIFLAQTDSGRPFNINIYKDGHRIRSFNQVVPSLSDFELSPILDKYHNNKSIGDANFLPTYKEEVSYHQLDLGRLIKGTYKIKIFATDQDGQLVNSEESSEFIVPNF